MSCFTHPTFSLSTNCTHSSVGLSCVGAVMHYHIQWLDIFPLLLEGEGCRAARQTEGRGTCAIERGELQAGLVTIQLCKFVAMILYTSVKKEYYFLSEWMCMRELYLLTFISIGTPTNSVLGFHFILCIFFLEIPCQHRPYCKQLN